MSVDLFADVLRREAVAEFVARQMEEVDAVPTPFPTLNAECKGDGGRIGLAYGWHVVLAGATNMGKSNLAINVACHAIQAGHSVVFVSLEMARHQIQQRAYSILTGEDSDRFSRGRTGPEELPVLNAMSDGVASAHQQRPMLLVNEKPIRNVHEITSNLDWFADTFGTRLFIVDYLQLCETGSDEERRRQVMEISATLMTYAHQNEALTIGLSQLSRHFTRDKGLSPEVEGMTESSSLENDADMVLLLDHSLYAKDQLCPWIHRTWLKIGKNRHGGKGSVPIEWNWKNYRAREALADEVDLWPKPPEKRARG